MAKFKKLTLNFRVDGREFYILPSIIYMYKWKSLYLGFLFFKLRIELD